MIDRLPPALQDRLDRLAAGTYYTAVRALRPAMDRLGVLSYLEGRRDSPTLFYLRTVFSIWDAEDLVRLDLPWWTFAATRAVEGYLRSLGGRAVVFEYGGGASTAWLAGRCAEVYSLDHDPEWTRATSELCVDYANVTYLTRVPESDPAEKDDAFSSVKPGYRDVTFKRYVESIRSTDRRFDLVVIDGRCRSQSLRAAVEAIKDDGVIVFDDSKRARYWPAFDETGFEIKRYRGRSPGLPNHSETAVLGADLSFMDPFAE